MYFYRLLALIWILCGWCGSVDTYAQRGKDHLLPSTGYFTSYAHERAYYSRVRDVLGAGLTDTPLAQVVLPSFTPEYLLSLEERDGKYYLTYRICETSVWVNVQETMPPSISVKTTTVELSQPAATAVVAAIRQAVSQTHYPEPSKIITLGFDGTTYEFSDYQRGVGLQGGQTWSPRTGTTMGDLVALVTNLKNVTAAPIDVQLQTALIQQAQQLVVRLTDK